MIQTHCPPTQLPRSRLRVSRIGLGLAHTHLMDFQTRCALIEQALALGITHFDTSRFYSDGLSETTLGRVLGHRRSSVTIATKFGLLPTPFIGSAGVLGTTLRKARSVLSKLRIVPYPLRSYTKNTMRKALHASLKALKTDYVDIYHIHEPLPTTALTDDLFTELKRAQAAGMVRWIGVSGADINHVVREYGRSLDVIQVAESKWTEGDWTPDITHSLFSDAVREANGSLPSGTVKTMLASALSRRVDGAVIVQTRNPGRLAELVEIASQK